jgi:putative membrane protein
MMGNYGMVSGFGFGWIFMILFWVLIIVGIISLVKWMGNSAGGSGRNKDDSSALEILKQRYARGEINDQEFKKIKQDLLE